MNDKDTPLKIQLGGFEPRPGAKHTKQSLMLKADKAVLNCHIGHQPRYVLIIHNKKYI